jgi:hypothetical protein
MAKVFVKFPSAGLGNMMLPWARAVVFARLNNLPLVVSLWWSFHPGPFLRGELKKRLYWGYFKETSLFKLAAFHLFSSSAKKVEEPELKVLTDAERKQNNVYQFNLIDPDPANIFGYIADHSELVKQELLNLVQPGVYKQYMAAPAPVISIHVRRGDFKNYGNGVKLTSLDYFIKAINLVRTAAGKTLPVTVFTDAHPDELKEIFDLPEVYMSQNNTDILDILMLGRSKVIVLSKGSTFSYWGAYLSDALIIRPWDKQERIKYPSGNYSEIKWNDDNAEVDVQIMNAVKGIRF